MKSLPAKDIPPQAAVAVVALVLFATVVTGREAPPASAGAEIRPAAAARPADADTGLDLESIRRPKTEEVIANLFAPRDFSPALPASSVPGKAGAAPSSAPVAPPLPFQYLGKIVDGDQTSVFVIRGEEHYSVEPGQTIDKQYKVERVTETAITFTYLPLGTRQVLPVPALN
jgi:hypothetical protein